MKKTRSDNIGEVRSPCTKECFLDRNRICTGCYRSVEEIASWPDSDDFTRKKILEAVALRRARIKKVTK